MPNNDAYRFSVRDDTTWIHSGSEEGGGESLASSCNLTLNLAGVSLPSNEIFYGYFIMEGQEAGTDYYINGDIYLEPNVDTYELTLIKLGGATRCYFDIASNYTLTNLSGQIEERKDFDEDLNKWFTSYVITGDCSADVAPIENDDAPSEPEEG